MTMSKDCKVSIVIVTYNASKYVVPCIRSVLTPHGVTVDEVIVVDNASSDGTVHLVEKCFGTDPRIKMIELRKNVGFPLACNIGVVNAGNEFVVLMNPDVIVEPDCFAKLVEAMLSDERIAVAQPKILHPGGFIDSVGGLMDLLGHGFHVGKFEKDHRQYDEPRDMLYACFACAMVRRDIYLELGGMDSRYFLYNEDLDFCWRCWLAGYRVVYVPTAIAYHVGQHATRKLPYHAIYFGRRNRLYTVFKNYPLLLAVATTLLLLASYSLVGFKAIFSDRIESRLMLKIVSKFFSNAKYLARERMRIVRKRGVRWFLKHGLIVPKLVGLRLYLENLYRRQLGLS